MLIVQIVTKIEKLKLYWIKSPVWTQAQIYLMLLFNFGIQAFNYILI